MEAKTALSRAALKLIAPHTVIGLGASSVMPSLVDLIADAMQKGIQLKILSSSLVTQQLLLQKGIYPQAISHYSAIDSYFDGCDQMDHQLNAVKSGGGIHTMEKLLACMSKEFILLGDASKYTQTFNPVYPLVLEILPAAILYVQSKVYQLFPQCRCTLRMSDRYTGAAITENGNYLLDILFVSWPEASFVHTTCKQITGVVETSIFYKIATKALVFERDVVVEKFPE